MKKKASFVSKQVEKERWQQIYEKGRQTAEKFKITSEEDVDTVLHGS